MCVKDKLVHYSNTYNNHKPQQAERLLCVITSQCVNGLSVCHNVTFTGLGVAMVATNTMIAGYYAVIICWCMYFFFASMAASVPWAECTNWWNTELCVTPEQTANLTGRSRHKASQYTQMILTFIVCVPREWLAFSIRDIFKVGNPLHPNWTIFSNRLALISRGSLVIYHIPIISLS
jgi:hypothetical protein